MINDRTTEIRREKFTDFTAIREVNREAFVGPTEAELVDALRTKIACISLVALSDRVVVGHILFTPVEVIGPSGMARVAGLGPMAVRPGWQRKGVGSLLFREGLEECKRSGYEAVVLLGHAEYYPRFGFVPASRFGLRCEFDAPDEAFMALELRSGALGAGGGVVRYDSEFSRGCR
jgi:putative acetyltransferase